MLYNNIRTYILLHLLLNKIISISEDHASRDPELFPFVSTLIETINPLKPMQIPPNPACHCERCVRRNPHHQLSLRAVCAKQSPTLPVIASVFAKKSPTPPVIASSVREAIPTTACHCEPLARRGEAIPNSDSIVNQQ